MRALRLGKGSPSPSDPDLELRDHIQRLALEWPQYGYCRITAQLHRQGIEANHKRILRLMREDNLLCLRKRRFISMTDSTHGLSIYPNLVPYLTVSSINRLWVSDFTYIRLWREFLYLADILDAYSRRCIGWALEPYPPVRPVEALADDVDAQRAVAEAERLRNQWTKTSLLESIKKYQEAQAHWHGLKKKIEESGAIKKMGDVYVILSQSQKALNCYDQALALSRAASAQQLEIGTMNSIANISIDLGETHKAPQYSTQALKLSRNITYSSGEAQALNNLGLVAYFLVIWRRHLTCSIRRYAYGKLPTTPAVRPKP